MTLKRATVDFLDLSAQRSALAPLHVSSSHSASCLFADNLDYINEAILIVRDRVNMSVIELSTSSAAQVFVTFICPFPAVERCRNEEDLDEVMQLSPTVVNDR